LTAAEALPDLAASLNQFLFLFYFKLLSTYNFLANITDGFQCGLFGHLGAGSCDHIGSQAFYEFWPLFDGKFCYCYICYTLGSRAWPVVLCSQSTQNLEKKKNKNKYSN